MDNEFTTLMTVISFIILVAIISIAINKDKPTYNTDLFQVARKLEINLDKQEWNVLSDEQKMQIITLREKTSELNKQK